ncbi:hypothetical protein ASPZODRAFT_135703 [Penicilliopsis zonata CBS 506.65]|uniref:Purine nucleoside phosphorylase n=1 Tax=Penicilliopsis zonata CBS 506.65 TaxID=1073090 RepID=A0A1L9S979_9EURO|nr:hypothetical protein ASPZODRAFT_135703 [Penicilliopsis zonata CBS 506.65]OJJ43708.1 hypothetical protein ASPZODRAFT_135703 [Penicilliopsis zonata CBS 506.65]
MSQLQTEASLFDKAKDTIEFLKSRLPSPLLAPRVAIVCGSGLGGLADTVHSSPKAEYDYSDIPHFPQLTVTGHSGKLVFGLLAGKVPAVLMVGRAHFYEGHSIDQVTFPIRVFKLMGIETIFLTNAAGGLNPEYAVGDIVVLNDHIFLAGLAGIHPLRGPNEPEFGVRFPALSDAYDLELRCSVHNAWKSKASETSRRLHEGVYAFVGGPSYETRAECRMLHLLGADVVGMSTVPEIVVARHCGIRVAALSLVTNKAVLSPVPRGDDSFLHTRDADELGAIMTEGKANHEEVIEAGRAAAFDMQMLVQAVVLNMWAAES